MAELVVPAEPPFIREMPLCCLVSPKFRCRKCGGTVCNTCNDKDIELRDKLGMDIGYMGHTKESCLEDENAEVVNCYWDAA